MRCLLALALLFSTSSALAQAPHEDWRTLETQTFRVHYPEPWEEWATRAAARLESARERVAVAVGFDPDERIDVIVLDPAATANGMAFPLLGRPRIILWTTPPEALSAIGDSRDWQEQLIVHETAHILHLNRPSRNRLNAFFERILPIGPIATAPRWVSEGYATVIEGELTGSGRPFRDYRAAVLRQWAASGNLPAYSQLHRDDRSFMGMSMAYLVGSAYLEWLRDRSSPDSLRHLWRRMTAREDRTFEQAFAGVFGDSPEDLYALFRAELTQRARNLAETLEPSLRGGEIVLDFSRRAGPMSVLSDGSKVAVVVRPREEPALIGVWDTAVDDDAVSERNEDIAELLERDPFDVAPVPPRVSPRRRLHAHRLPRGGDVESLAFLSSGELAFTSSHPDDDGVLHSELHVWDLDEDRVRRVTTRGDLFAISPEPGSRTVAAIRHRHGKSALVRVDLQTAEVVELGPPALEPVVADLAVSPDGRIAWIERSEGVWTVQVADRDLSGRVSFPAPAGAMVGDLSWSPDGATLFASLGLNGFIEIARLDLAEGTWSDVTRSTGASFSPGATEDAVYFLSLDSKGIDVRAIPRGGEVLEIGSRPGDPRFAPVVRVPSPPETPAPLEARSVEGPRPYGFGPRELNSIFGGYTTSEARLFEAGVRWGDPIGRLETMLALGWSSDHERGALLDARFRNTYAPVSAGGWSWTSGDGTVERRGVRTGLDRTWRARNRNLSIGGSLGWEDFESEWREDSGAAAAIETRAALGTELGSVRIHSSVHLWSDWNDAEGQDRLRGALDVRVGRGSFALGFSDSAGVGSDHAAFRLGGIRSSILPHFERGALVEVPALAPGRAAGKEFRSQQISLVVPVVPGELFAHRLTVPRTSEDERIDLVGWRISLLTPAMPVIGFPSIVIDLGVAQELDEPGDRDLGWWIGTRWRLE